jgi:threonylcarbamoyladenosine tRNA methylthiotransferase MtaB
MARRCKTEEFTQIVDLARTTIPHFNITTDIIVGFPGETELEWQESYDFIKAIGFGHIHIFSYSPREGTAAATFPNPVSQEIKKLRSKQLHELAETMKHNFMQQNLGTTTSILWEGQSEALDNDTTRYFGYTPNYLRVACEVNNAELLENRILPTHLIELGPNYISGKVKD